MGDFSLELKNTKAQSILIVSDPQKSRAAVWDAIEVMMNERGNVILYISLNHPFKKIESEFEKRKLNKKKLFCIDCMSSIAHQQKSVENVLFLSNPGDLTKIDISIKQLAPFVGSDGCIILDSIQTLLMYNQPLAVARFVQSVLAETSDHNLKAIIFASPDEHHELFNQISD